MCIHIFLYACVYYGVATSSSLLQIIGIFCRLSSLLCGSFAKETCNLKEPTTRSHPILFCFHQDSVGKALRVCTCVCVCVCVYIHIVYVSIHTYRCICIHEYIYICVYINIYTRLAATLLFASRWCRKGSACVLVRVCVCIHIVYVSIHIYICICIHEYIFICLYTYI